MGKPSFTAKALAARWGVQEATLSQWRWNGRGPIFVKEGHQISYLVEDVKSFEKQQRRQTTGSTHKKDFAQEAHINNREEDEMTEE